MNHRQRLGTHASGSEGHEEVFRAVFLRLRLNNLLVLIIMAETSYLRKIFEGLDISDSLLRSLISIRAIVSTCVFIPLYDSTTIENQLLPDQN